MKRILEYALAVIVGFALFPLAVALAVIYVVAVYGMAVWMLICGVTDWFDKDCEHRASKSLSEWEAEAS
jgi:nitrate reductase NapE component